MKWRQKERFKKTIDEKLVLWKDNIEKPLAKLTKRKKPKLIKS
jgi:hypothetical protein